MKKFVESLIKLGTKTVLKNLDSKKGIPEMRTEDSPLKQILKEISNGKTNKKDH